MILGFADYEDQGRRLAQALGLPFVLADLHRFPDGESRLTLPPALPETVVLCRSLDRPNSKLVELMLAARTARQLGAQRLILVAPYLCYMRQDIAFHPGEAVSQRIVGEFLGALFDAVVTVDPHLHRIGHLEEAIIGAKAVSLSAAPAMTDFLRRRGGKPLLVGPDGESEQWVRAIAEPAGLDYRVARKERLGDREVRIHLDAAACASREVVLVDDMASTGRTLAAVAAELKAAGAGPLHCLVTHALFGDDVLELLHNAGIKGIWSSDSIAHPTNRVALTLLLAEALTRLLDPHGTAG